MKTKIEKTDKGLTYETVADWASFPLVFGVTLKEGGHSQGPYAQGNQAFHVGDRVEDVQANRRDLAEHLGVQPEDLTCGEQIHGSSIAYVDGHNRGSGALDLSSAIGGTDALITDQTNTALLLLVADCVPVLIYDKGHGAIAVIHAGWRGVYDSLTMKTFTRMKEQFGTQAEDCYVYIGPSIQSQSFEVSEDLARDFWKAKKPLGVTGLVSYHGTCIDPSMHGDEPGSAPCFCKQPHLDLQGCIAQELVLGGFDGDKIVRSPLDSMTSAECFSYRRDKGTTGRMALFAMLRP